MSTNNSNFNDILENEDNTDILIEIIKNPNIKFDIPRYLCKDDSKYVNCAICVRCNNLAIDSLMCHYCECLYCNKCARNINNSNNQEICNNCKKFLNLEKINITNKRLVENILIFCPSENTECKDEIIFSDLKRHLEKCAYWRGLAKCRGCERFGYYNETLNHAKNCDLVIIKCKY